MLRTRIITASILAPIAVALIWFLPVSLFAEAMLLLMVIALSEWNGLTRKSITGFVVGALGLLIVAVILFVLDAPVLTNSIPALIPALLIAGTLFWITQIVVLSKGIDYRRSLLTEWVLGIAILLFAWAAMVWIRMHEPDGHIKVLIAIIVVWAADTFAYFAGVNFGRRKLAPSISPGKTVEGVVGGLLGAILIAWFGAFLLLNLSFSALIAWLVAAFFAALVSVAGDLYVSRLKRHAGVKDSGRLLPGHGGLLDRIDGLLAAMPVFACVWWLLS